MAIGLENKLSTPEKALSIIKSGDRIFIGTACATPRMLIQKLESMHNLLFDLKLIHFLTDGSILIENGSPKTNFQHKVYFVGTDTLEAVKQGKAEYIPISIVQLADLIKKDLIEFDLAIIQVSLPDEHGYVSLGVSVDVTKLAVLKAKKVIAELNPNMPYTLGDSIIPLDRIDHLVEVDTPVIEYLHEPIDEVAKKIARYVARIISDNSTLNIGLGRIPNHMLKYLTNRKNLGIHSDVITDSVIDLIEQGVITGNKKTNHQGQVVTSYCMGTGRLYNFVHRNPRFAFYPIDYVCQPEILAGNNQMVSVSQAFAIDLTGQVCADQFNGVFYGGVSAQPELIRGTASSKGGKPIICLSSTTDDKRESRIRPLLLEGEGVTISRSDVHYVITEYGYAYLFGKSIQERALSLIEIAHPSFRAWLLEEGKRLGYIRRDQILRSTVAYPEEEEREVELKKGQKVLIRPTKASDVQGLQDIFYHLKPKDIFTRFFIHLKSFTASKAQHLCNVDYEQEMAFLAITGDRDRGMVIGSSCYFVDPTDNLAEVAYMIRPEWQNLGVGTALQKRMTEYAKSRGLRGFKATILVENVKMQRLIQKYSKVEIKRPEGEYEVTVLF